MGHLNYTDVQYNELFAVEPPPPSEPHQPEPEQLGLAEQVEQLRSSILAKTDAIRELRSRLRTTCVPLSVCTYLGQCIKDTDVCAIDVMTQLEVVGEGS